MLTRHIALFLSLIFAVVLVQSGFCADIDPHHWDTQVRGLGEKNARARSFRLAVTGKKVVPALIHGIGATNWKERYWIGATLGQIGGASTKRPLLQLLSDRDWRVRLSALLGLTQAFGTSRNLPARTLATLQHDPSQRVRDAFHYVTGTKADYYPLRQMLSHLEGSDSRLKWSDPGLEHTHDVLSIQGTTVITNFDGPSPTRNLPAGDVPDASKRIAISFRAICLPSASQTSRYAVKAWECRNRVYSNPTSESGPKSGGIGSSFAFSHTDCKGSKTESPRTIGCFIRHGRRLAYAYDARACDADGRRGIDSCLSDMAWSSTPVPRT